ncbi:MAG: HAMP domain-containing sensor histidine kinase [Crocinitomicaceae bacterium]
MASKNKKNATEYAENLSHELLTPLAIIRSKAELLLQSPNLKSDDLKNIDAIIKNVARMNSLNRSLILLSKIDNKVYEDREEVNIQEVCEEALENYENQIRLKSLKIRVKSSSESTITTNRTLIEILVNNLLKNAVTHNVLDGEITIVIDASFFTIQNSFDQKHPPPKNHFKRFTTSKGDKGSIGLGLSIVKRIVKFLNFDLHVELNHHTYSTKIIF